MRRCDIGDLPRLEGFYQLVASEKDDMPRFGRWVYGLHPTGEMIEGYVREGAMYCLEDGQDIAAAVAVTPYQGEDYHGVDWQVELADNDVAVVHLLAVNPRLQRSGYAKAVMREAIELARGEGLGAVRLDALECNVPAHGLYESLGFERRDVRHWHAPNTGWIDFYLYELLLR